MDESLGVWTMIYTILCLFYMPCFLWMVWETKYTEREWRWTWNWLIVTVLFLPGFVALVLFGVVATVLTKLWEALDIPVWREEDD
jgi:predicted Na+-dependent transporter